MKYQLLAGLLLCSSVVSARAQENPRTADESAIRKAVEDYVTAFNQKDAKSLAAKWSTEAVYLNPISGVQVTGRDAIEKQFAGIFADDSKLKLVVNTESIRFISPSVAVEDGNAKLFSGDKVAEESNYTAIYVKRDGQWLLDRVTEEDIVETPSHFEQLKELEWLIGRWTDSDESATVVTECKWAKNNNFIVRSFTVQIGDRIDMAGMQIIGWDPSTKTIRSWVFDSDGGFGQGAWKRKGDRWTVQNVGVLPGGGKVSETNIITRIDDNNCTLQSVNRTVDGELQPNIDEVKITKEKL